MNQGRTDFFIIVLYVDDILLACNLLSEILSMKRKRFEKDSISMIWAELLDNFIDQRRLLKKYNLKKDLNVERHTKVGASH
jgi:hypothetical protein